MMQQGIFNSIGVPHLRLEGTTAWGVWLRINYPVGGLSRRARLRCGVLYHVACGFPACQISRESKASRIVEPTSDEQVKHKRVTRRSKDTHKRRIGKRGGESRKNGGGSARAGPRLSWV